MNDLRSGKDCNGGDVKALIFDMDNTLFDLVGAKMTACSCVAGFLGREDGEELFSYFTRPDWGFEDWRNIRDYLVERDIFSPARYHEACSIYETEKLSAITVYPGVPEVLGELKATGVPLALVTDADMRHTRLRLEKTKLISAFDHMVTFEMTGKKKPSQEPFLLALRKLGKQGYETVMIGDSPHRDLAPAQQIGMHTVYARYGDRSAGSRGDITESIILDNILDLPGLLIPLIA